MTSIPGLTQTDPTANIAAGNKVFFEPAVLTVRGKSQYRDDEISFVEISNFWSLPQNFVYNDAPRQPGTNPSDGNLHPGDVCTFNLNLNPKRGQNAKPGAFYANIGSVSGAGGQQPVQAQPAQDPREEWVSPDDIQPQGRPDLAGLQTPAGWYTYDPKHYYFEAKGERKTEQILKGQALNLLFDTINAYVPLAEKIESLKKMGFESMEEAKAVAGEQWNNLRDGLTPFMPIDEDAWEDPAAELDQQAQQHMAEMQPPAEEDIENVPW
jgi:hypothetical protein